MTEPGAGSDLQGVRTTATPTGDDGNYSLSGSKTFITNGTRVLHPLRFFKLEDTAGIINALVSALMTPSSILSGDSFYADMRSFNENS